MRRRGLLAAAGLAVLPRSAQAAEVDVAIIGAGVAGLAAAHALIAAKKSVVVLEARNRIGGRTFTETGLGVAFDTGAQWLEDGPLVAAIGARPAAVAAGTALVVDGRELKPEDYERAARIMAADEKAVAQIARELPGVDPRQVIAPRDPLDRLVLADLMRRLPFPTRLAVPQGVGTLVAQWGARVPVRLGVRVLRMDSTFRLVKIVAPTGEVEARSVIVTVPAGVLAAGGFGFAPPLGAPRRAALAALPTVPYEKVAVAFSRRVFDSGPDTRMLAITKAGAVIEALLRPQGREAAIVLFEGEEARQLAAGGASAAHATGLSALVEVFGKELRVAFAGAQATQWSHDPLARGAWSVGPAAQRAVLAAPHHDRIFFAGDATDRGTLAGAYASGLRAAQDVRNVLG